GGRRPVRQVVEKEGEACPGCPGESEEAAERGTTLEPAGIGRGEGRTGGAELLVPAVHLPEARPVDAPEALGGEGRPFEETAVEEEFAVDGCPTALGWLLAAAPRLERLVVVGHVEEHDQVGVDPLDVGREEVLLLDRVPARHAGS